MRATVRTLGVNKGELAFRFEFRFLTLNTEQPIVNGPNLAYVQPGGRYRFYLKKSDDFYVSMLDGEFDDGFAVHPLAPDEAADSLPLFDRDASPIARREFRRLRPESVIYGSTPAYQPRTGWTYTFYCRPPLDYPAFACEGEVTVSGARRIVPARSWVGLEEPRPGEELTENDLGPRLRVTIGGDIREGAFHPSQGVTTALLGQIEKMDEENITGTFTTLGSTEPRALTFPRKNLISVQQIFPADKIGSP